MWTRLITNWKVVLLATVIASSVAYGAVMNLRLKAVTAERDEKIAVIDSMRREAQTYAENSQRIAKEISDAHAELLVKTETHAFENAKKKFGSVACRPVRGIGTVGVLPTAPNDQSQAGSTTGTDELPVEESLAVSRSFVETCALDAGVTQSWGRWAVMNGLVSKD